jgi:hypothetical protein
MGISSETLQTSWLVQKKNKRGKSKAAKQDRPVPHIETKKSEHSLDLTSIATCAFAGQFVSAMRLVIRAM